MKTLFAIALILSVINVIGQNSVKNIKGGDAILDNEIILKIKPVFKSQCKSNSINIEAINNLIGPFNVSEIVNKFPKSKLPDKNDGKQTDISTIYSIVFNEAVPVQEIVNSLSSLPEVEYVQPVYLPELMYSPNDPLTAAQYYLNNLKAYEAWDICKGSSNVVIGITDTGVEYAHEDLVDNIAYNYNDPINGNDDDGDGYVDNFRGWDLGDNDNSAEWSEATPNGANSHGVYVSGYAAAKTDNNLGIASPGFLSRFLPVKISDSNGLLRASYEGIVYAADHGCQIINCSWGGTSPHPYGQDIVNYATFNRNALVISAAGNSGHASNDIYYPCAFANVICVAASNSADVKWYKSCYGNQVDVTAPGESVFGTTADNSYNNGWGTSFATPIAASVAALIVAFHQDTLSALQLGELMKLSCDNIDTVLANIPFAGKLGKGRLNMVKALSTITSPALVFENIQFSGPIAGEDTIYITGKVHNYLSACQNVNVTVTCSNPFIEITSSNQVIPAIGYNEDYIFSAIPFSFRILQDMPYDEIVSFKINFSSGTYNENQTFSTTLNLSYYDLDTNNIKVSFCSNGKYGINLFSPQQGIGVRYKSSENMIADAGIIAAYSPTKTLAAVYPRQDFGIIEPVRVFNNVIADVELISEFNDRLAPDSVENGLDIVQHIYAWTDSAAQDFYMIRFTIYNTQTLPISNLYFGLYTDWDIVNPILNKATFDSGRRLAIAYYQGITNMYTGIMAMSLHSTQHYAFDLIQGGNGGIDIITNGFTAEKMYQALSENRNDAGQNSNGADISNLMSYGPMYIEAGDSVVCDYVILAAGNEFSLLQIADEAISRYQQHLSSGISTVSSKNSPNVYPNPTKDILTIDFNAEIPSNSSLLVYDIYGRMVSAGYTVQQNKIRIKTSGLEDGCYYAQVSSNGEVSTFRFIKN